MTRIIFLLIIIFNSHIAGSQSLYMSDLIAISNKSRWQDVNQYLLAKGWTYFNSSKGDDDHYNTITWSFNKDLYSDKAAGWFYLFTYDGLPNKITYSVFNKPSYNKISSSLTTSGFKLTDSEIEDDEVTSDYENSKYKLSISFERKETDEWGDVSLTGYNLSMIKKAGIYDDENGKKYEYYDDGTLKAEYTLQNGILNGAITTYHENGEKSKSGYFKNNKKEGLFKEYDESGKISMEYLMSNDVLSGPYKIYYETGKLSETGTFKNDKKHGLIIDYNEFGEKNAEYNMLEGMKDGIHKTFENGKLKIQENYTSDVNNGPYAEYYYPEENDSIVIINKGEFLNGNKHGLWKLSYKAKNGERVINYETYKNGIKNGKFQEVRGDSIIVGNYKEDVLDGNYKVHIDLMHTLIGTPMKTDFRELKLILDGNYKDGVENGYWKYFDMNETLIEEGFFENGEKSGEWKYYHSSLFYNEKQKDQFIKKLYMIENYNGGYLNGKKSQFSTVYRKDYPCTEDDPTKSSFDTCTKIIFEKFLETSFYVNGELDGPYEFKDSTNTIISKGFFKKGLRDGEWTYRNVDTFPNGTTFTYYLKGFYKNDKYEGKWIKYNEKNHVFTSEEYKDGTLFGESIDWFNTGKPNEKRIFNGGDLESVTIYDSLGSSPVATYIIKDYSDQKLLCRKIDYKTNLTISTDYLIQLEEDLNPYMLALQFEVSLMRPKEKKIAFLEGPYQKNLANNQPLISGNYSMDKKSGAWTFYNYEHASKLVVEYENNQPLNEEYFTLAGTFYTGEFNFTDEENKIKEERKIKNGVRNGKTVYMDLITGRIIKTINFKDGIQKN